MAEKVKVGKQGEIILPLKLQRKFSIKAGAVLEIKEIKEGLLLKPFNPVAELKGLGRGIFGDPLEYQKKIRDEQSFTRL
jgi:bifunctional DNA-binding transcriptional regulator/antitoxin component of YhaV-PrlF toxin-antitoxin module